MVKDQQTDEQANRESLIYRFTSDALNSLSMTSALLVICAILCLRWKHKMNRVSLRLQMYIALNDMFFAAFQIMTVNSNPPGNWVCRVSPWGFVFTALLGCFLNVMIAFNLQIVFVHNYLNTQHLEKYYVIIPLALSFVLSIVPVIAGELGFDEKEVSCWYKNGSSPKAIIWEWFTLYGWIIMSVLYCIYSVVVISHRLYRANKFVKEMNRSLSHVIRNKDDNDDNSINPKNPLNLYFFKKINRNSGIKHYQHSYRRQMEVNRAVNRIILYPVVPIITFMFNIASSLLFFTSTRNFFFLQMLSNIGTSSQGFFNALAFCFDPAMKHIWGNIFKANLDANSSVNIKEKLNDATISNDGSDTIVNINDDKIVINVNQNVYYEYSDGSSGGDGGSSGNSDDDNNNDGIDDNNGDDNNYYDPEASIQTRVSKDEKYVINLL